MRLFTLLLLLAQSAYPSSTSQQAAVQTIAQVGQFVWADFASPGGDAVFVVGWDFENCSIEGVITQVEIDGVQVPSAIERIARVDVESWALSNGICPLTSSLTFSGVRSLVSTAAYAPGPHAAQLVIRNINGVVTRSRPVGFVK